MPQRSMRGQQRTDRCQSLGRSLHHVVASGSMDVHVEKCRRKRRIGKVEQGSMAGKLDLCTAGDGSDPAVLNHNDGIVDQTAPVPKPLRSHCRLHSSRLLQIPSATRPQAATAWRREADSNVCLFLGMSAAQAHRQNPGFDLERTERERAEPLNLAERGGFEPPVQLLTVQRFSKPPPSATRPSLRLSIRIIPKFAQPGGAFLSPAPRSPITGLGIRVGRIDAHGRLFPPGPQRANPAL